MSADIAGWRANMLKYGAQHADRAEFESVYYDAARVYYQIADLTGDPKWKDVARAKAEIYIKYVLDNPGGVASWEYFPHGLVRHHKETSDPRCIDALTNLASHQYASPDAPEWYTWGTDPRTIGYSLDAILCASEAGVNLPDEGGRRWARYCALSELGLAYPAHQMKVGFVSPAVFPFMCGLLADSLIQRHEYYRDRRYNQAVDPRTVPVLEKIAGYLWEYCWLDAEGCFTYADREYKADTNAGDDANRGPAPDLSLLIAPFIGWLYQQTGDLGWKWWGDKIFNGGVARASLDNPKQFNQCYRWSHKYIEWTGG